MLIDYLTKRKLEPVSRFFKKYNKGTITENEWLTLSEWIVQNHENLNLFTQYCPPKFNKNELKTVSGLQAESIKKLLSRIQKNKSGS